ncbi:tryptophanyl-tRNA synthetase [Methanocaldococcus infernus ME]|uniref:Tryptophan--tRNA ligase n=1 Tax=Methanocaldococcus infernus (strain DSM 11812 / JCM 15783 / ME) TaxID=573063 RepID=D5VRN2_METIM|nr:tryptophan--tRNA ligase [Methanocaldococcus infernus]ADG13235.1 tryptophanyl-tRNA synthetase [Methanocaldococcus infernus ME]
MLTPWETPESIDYKETMEKFGIKEFNFNEFNDFHLFRRKIIFGHRDFERILEAIKKNDNFAVVSGMMPSGKMHFGHKMVVDILKFYQEFTDKIYIPIADLEAYWARNISFEKAKEIALNEYIINYLALGLDPEKVKIYLQSKNEKVKDLSLRLAKRTNFNEMKAIYGFTGETNIGHVFAPIVQVSDILNPEFDENLEPSPLPVVVPVGIDQDPHIRLTRDIAKRVKITPPSSTYHRFMRGLLGGKMSSSKPETAIFLTDSPEVVKKKIFRAKTGGRETLEEHKKYGGIPEECVIYELFLYHLILDDKELKEIYESCKRGELTCGKCKKIAYNKVVEFLKELKERRDEVLDKALELI